MASLFALATRRAGATHLRHLSPVPMAAATGLVAVVYREIERNFGMLAPPLALHAAAPATLAATWTLLRETLLVPGLLGRAAKEAMAAAVSAANRCPYCVDVHGATLTGLLRQRTAAATPRIGALAEWAGSDQAGEPPCGSAESPEAIGLVVTFHYINRMVNIFLSGSPLPPLPEPALAPVRWVAARILGRLARALPPASASSALLPEAPLPADLVWTTGRPEIAAAFARACGAIDDAGLRSVPEAVRRLVTGRLAAGDRPGWGSGSWLAEAVRPLAGPDRPAGRLALLAATGSYLVTDAMVTDFRDQGHSEQALVELTSWASMAAARDVGRRLGR